MAYNRSPKLGASKCVRIVGPGGIPVRVSVADAHRLVVTDKDAEYCPKSVFKKRRTEHPEHPARSRINSKNEIVAA